ncbi:rCG30760 [Rattus norvegicus]|uniref:RCG30760 n=1 Tax=Rattus norvegicus TaxID=10116 RepID=A6ITH5_RAT|nr:rCG30760 [Rattus norvegicus]
MLVRTRQRVSQGWSPDDMAFTTELGSSTVDRSSRAVFSELCLEVLTA